MLSEHLFDYWLIFSFGIISTKNWKFVLRKGSGCQLKKTRAHSSALNIDLWLWVAPSGFFPICSPPAEAKRLRKISFQTGSTAESQIRVTLRPLGRRKRLKHIHTSKAFVRPSGVLPPSLARAAGAGVLGLVALSRSDKILYCSSAVCMLAVLCAYYGVRCISLAYSVVWYATLIELSITKLVVDSRHRSVTYFQCHEISMDAMYIVAFVHTYVHMYVCMYLMGWPSFVWWWTKRLNMFVYENDDWDYVIKLLVMKEFFQFMSLIPTLRRGSMPELYDSLLTFAI